MFLDKNQERSALKRRYEKENNFTHDERQTLVRILSDHLVKITYKISIPVFEEISNQIALVFVFEEKVRKLLFNFDSLFTNAFDITYPARISLQ